MAPFSRSLAHTGGAAGGTGNPSSQLRDGLLGHATRQALLPTQGAHAVDRCACQERCGSRRIVILVGDRQHLRLTAVLLLQQGRVRRYNEVVHLAM
eukprot:CAMPEP_0180805268 /NCGR_PEP_ID=MMETSP1038_2-20121128/61922_1 /TAXON_ID=632150 /ORGANISM="Azadinium spinosum, Strain 3D9" /LENGTH=95 /DNA_ID=CAMNT_0022845803 /DNA_START=37 /DNA_END=324 /DNA_ORIENTATION=+